MNAPQTPFPLPDWLVTEAEGTPVSDPAPPEPPEPPAKRNPPAEPTLDRRKAITALEIQTWNIAFETILERLADGIPFDTICREYNSHAPAPTPLQPSRFRAWIYRSPRRREAYLAAKAVGAEAIEDQMMRIADGLDPDGNPTPNDVSRSQLQIGTRKWLLGKWNPGRYGDKTIVEQTTTTRVDPTSLSTVDLQQRLLQSLGVDLPLLPSSQSSQSPLSSDSGGDNDGDTDIEGELA